MDVSSPPPSAPPAAPELDPSSGLLRLLANAFILFHVTAIVVWNMPRSHTQSLIKSRITRYMSYFGLDQGWGMFAPEPGRENYYMQAQFTLRDGSKAHLPLGRADILNPFARLINERERKMVENLYGPGNGSAHYNQMALWQLGKLEKDPKNPPVKVEITRHWSPIPPLPGGIRKPPVSGWSTDVVYSLKLDGKGNR